MSAMVTTVRSNPGPRDVNQDSGLCVQLQVQASIDNGGQPVAETVTIIIVLDGVSSAGHGYEGSHHGGSLLAQHLVLSLCGSGTDSSGRWNSTSLLTACQDAVAAVNAFLCRQSQQAPASHVTTLALLVHAGQHAVLAHLGDSAIHCFRNGRLTKLVREHTLLNERNDADPVASKGVITRALGKSLVMEADYQVVNTSPGQLFLLNTDGVTGVLNEDAIAAIIKRELGVPPSRSGLSRCAETIIKTALLARTTDNITVALGLVVPPDSSVTRICLAPPAFVLPASGKR